MSAIETFIAETRSDPAHFAVNIATVDKKGETTALTVSCRLGAFITKARVPTLEIELARMGPVELAKAIKRELWAQIAAHQKEAAR